MANTVFHINNDQYNRKFTNLIVDEIKNIFSDCFHLNDSSLYSWGSTCRREMGKFSDIDLIIIDNSNQTNENINKFIKIVNSQFPHNNIDLLQKYSSEKLIRIAKIDGGDRQAITLSRLETGNNSISEEFEYKIQENLNNQYEKIRELIYIMINLKNVYPYLFPKYDLKFGKYCLRYINYAYLFCNYYNNENKRIYDTQSSLYYLFKESVITKKMCEDSISALNFILLLRDEVFDSRNQEARTIDSNRNSTIKDHICCSNTINHCLENHKDNIKELLDVLFLKTMDLLENEIGKRDTEILDNLVNYYSKELEKNPGLLNSEVLSMALSYCTSNDTILEQLYCKYLENWYILFGIANNRFSSPFILNKLVNPKGKTKKILELHQDFAWRNIYLYVARNPCTNYETLEIIKNYKFARKIDTETAIKNMAMKVKA